ncbi:MAG: hypothetical protein H0T89_20255 [Deltaproteobacteria bacterium]|nr:hypothetical protein [Deltaproteobacteria bacterium]
MTGLEDRTQSYDSFSLLPYTEELWSTLDRATAQVGDVVGSFVFCQFGETPIDDVANPSYVGTTTTGGCCGDGAIAVVREWT